MIYLHAKREHSVIENYRLLRNVVVYYGTNLNLYQMIRHYNQKTAISPDATVKNSYVENWIYLL
jgi:hypothetical protein